MHPNAGTVLRKPLLGRAGDNGLLRFFLSLLAALGRLPHVNRNPTHFSLAGFGNVACTAGPPACLPALILQRDSSTVTSNPDNVSCLVFTHNQWRDTGCPQRCCAAGFMKITSLQIWKLEGLKVRREKWQECKLWPTFLNRSWTFCWTHDKNLPSAQAFCPIITI